MSDDPPEDPADVRFVGPATAASLSAADIPVGAIPRKEVSYRQLVDAGVNPGVATKLRREHSLAWSLEGASEDLAQRSEKVRGLEDGERAWVAASTGDWEAADPAAGDAEADGSGEAAAAEAAWRERSKPDPVTDVPGVSEDDAAKLARAGINSVRSLATADAEMVADVLDLEEATVAEWRDAAGEHR